MKIPASLKIILLVLLIFSCRRAKSPEEDSSFILDKYSYLDYNGCLFVSHDEKSRELRCVLCADVAGIKGRMRMTHPCTEIQFRNLDKKLKEMGASRLESQSLPDFSDYPDLSMYLTFVISRDELHEIWKSLGLEE